MPRQKDPDAPVEQTVVVDCPIEDAFELFTERFGEWWPHDSGSSCELVESDPPRRASFIWNRDERQCVEVTFSVVADGTRVTVTHTGWRNARVQNAALDGFARMVSEMAVMA